jgi:hypothetical protein
MSDRDVVVVNSGGRAGWFIAGGLVVAAIIGAVLYFGGFLGADDRKVEISVDVPKIAEPEGQ